MMKRDLNKIYSKDNLKFNCEHYIFFGQHRKKLEIIKICEKMICREGKVSLIAFSISLIVQLIGVSEIGEKFGLLISESIFSSIYCLFILYFVFLIILLSIIFKSNDFQVIKNVLLTFLIKLYNFRLQSELEFWDIFLEFHYSSFLR